MVRIVVDANVLVSADFDGTPFDAAGKAFSVEVVYLSPSIAADIGGTIELAVAPRRVPELPKGLKILTSREFKS